MKNLLIYSLILLLGVSKSSGQVSSLSFLQELPIWEEAYLQKEKTDWLIDPTPYKAQAFRKGKRDMVLSNGLISRTFRLSPNAATVAFDQLTSQTSLLRGVKPEARVTLDSVSYDIGGLSGQSNYAFLLDEWVDDLEKNSSSFQLQGIEIEESIAPFTWKQVRQHAPNVNWPASGIQVRMQFVLNQGEHSDLQIWVAYELYDGVPVLAKWIEVENTSFDTVRIDHFTSEILAAVEYESRVEDRGAPFFPPNIHVETDFAMGGMTTDNTTHYSVHWKPDPEFHTQVNYLKNTPCLLEVHPSLGPGIHVVPGDTFTSFRTYVLPYDSYERERNGLAKRRMYRTLAPWTTENPLMMHVRYADWETVKAAIDQCAEVGFEMVILTFGSGFNIENDSSQYLEQMQQYAAYAQSRGIEMGGYSLLASRSIDSLNDVRMPPGKTPTYGNSPCLVSEWGEAYFDKLYHFYQQSGFSLLEHDGNYPGDECISTEHPGHIGHEDSRWRQWEKITDFYKWCRSQGIYLNVPDYYYLSGSNKCGMGYREVNWSLPRAQQVLHTRQNIFDGTWEKTPSMGWMFVPLTEYHGGGSAATIEPLAEHLDHYEKMLVGNLAGGVQACYRGPRLFDSPETKALVKKWIDWYKTHREVLEGDIIHLRRADGRDLDYWLNVNPGGKEKGLLAVFNPLNKEMVKTLKIPLYFTGLRDEVTVTDPSGGRTFVKLKRDYSIELKVVVPAEGFSWYLFE